MSIPTRSTCPRTSAGPRRRSCRGGGDPSPTTQGHGGDPHLQLGHGAALVHRQRAGAVVRRVGALGHRRRVHRRVGSDGGPRSTIREFIGATWQSNSSSQVGPNETLPWPGLTAGTWPIWATTTCGCRTTCRSWWVRSMQAPRVRLRPAAPHRSGAAAVRVTARRLLVQQWRLAGAHLDDASPRRRPRCRRMALSRRGQHDGCRERSVGPPRPVVRPPRVARRGRVTEAPCRAALRRVRERPCDEQAAWWARISAAADPAAFVAEPMASCDHQPATKPARPRRRCRTAPSPPSNAIAWPTPTRASTTPSAAPMATTTSGQATAKSRQVPSMPFNSWSPRSSKWAEPPSIMSRTVDDAQNSPSDERPARLAQRGSRRYRRCRGRRGPRSPRRARRADLDAESGELVAQRTTTIDALRRCIEHDQQPIAGALDHSATMVIDQLASKPVVVIEHGTPRGITERARRAGRVDDVVNATVAKRRAANRSTGAPVRNSSIGSTIARQLGDAHEKWSSASTSTCSRR